MIRNFLCSIAEPIVRSIVDQGCDVAEAAPPTEVPGQADFVLTALPAAIQVDIIEPTTGGRVQGNSVRIRIRNEADTAWESAQAWIDIGTRRSYIFTQYTENQPIEVGRKYQVKVISYNVVGDGAESAYKEVVPLTNLPAVPPFTLEAHDAAIRLTLTKVDDPLMVRNPTYEYLIEERNAADTAWVADADGSQNITSDRFGAAGTHRIISDTDTQLVIDILQTRTTGQSSHRLINDRAYRIRVRSENDAGYSDWSTYMSATPMAGVVPAQRPGIPTFVFSALRYEVENSQVRTTVNFTPTPNADGVGVTRWLFRYRVSGTTDWTNQVVVAQPELDTEYGFKLNQSELGKTYEVQVGSRNDAGDSAYASTQTIVITRPLPQVPTFSIAYHPFVWDDALSFQVDPVAPTSPVLPLTGYHWRFRDVGATTWTTAESNIAPVYASEVETSSIGKQIEIQMRAVNAAGNSDWSASQQLQIIGVPNRPDLFLTAQAGGFDVRIVSPPTGYRATGQTFRYREQGTTAWTDGSRVNVRGLKGLTAYEVQAWASNPAGRSLVTTRTVTTLAVQRVRGQLAVYGDNLAVYGDNLKVYGV